MLRLPGVVYRHFAEPEPTVALGVAFREPPAVTVRRFADLARELGQQPRPGKRSQL
jgi:hypothetical protein